MNENSRYNSKVINHLVLFRIKKEANSSQITNFLNALKTLQNIKGVIWAEGGKQEVMYPNYQDRSLGYNYIVIFFVLKNFIY